MSSNTPAEAAAPITAAEARRSPVDSHPPAAAACAEDLAPSSNGDNHAAGPHSAVKAKATPPTTLEEMNQQLDSLLYTLRMLRRLQERHEYISKREVESLRKAFTFTVSEVEKFESSPGTAGKTAGEPTNPKAAEAAKLLDGLEAYMEASPVSSTFETTTNSFSWRSVFCTPGERRMQSLMISIFMFFTFIPLSIALTCLLLLSKYTAPLMILYLISIFTFGKVQHPVKRNKRVCQSKIWLRYRDYFPTRLVVEEHVRRQFDGSKNYLFGYHPHGVHGFGAIMNFGLDTNEFWQTICPQITTHLQTLKINFYVPFWRQLALWMGCGDASAATIRKTLRSGPGQSVVLVVGGAEESLLSKPGTNDLYLMHRKGFVKIALQEGAPLVPVYGFGENNAYRVPSIAEHPTVKKAMRVIKKYTGFVPILFIGRGFFNFRFGLLPHRSPIVVVVGEPIDVPRIAEPTAEDLEFWQQQYIVALEKLYERHRGLYDLESTGLRIMN